jgi:hypothetical protein
MVARLFRESMLSRSSRISILALALAAAVALVPGGAAARPHATPTASPTPTPPPEDPAITIIAKREFVAWQAGVVNPERYEPESRSNITAQKVATTSQGLGQAGSLKSTQWIGPLVIDDAPPGVKGYIYKMHCESKDVYEELMMGADGKVAGILFKDDLKEQAPSPSPSPTPFATP